MAAEAIPEWWTSREADIRAQMNGLKRGRSWCLATSPGGRPVLTAAYGEAEPALRGTANYNSALGARQPDAFFRRRERRRPVMLILAGAHGHETEGMIGALSVLRLLETGVDLLGRPQPALLEALRRLRVIVIPLANPDGRARVPLDGFVGCDMQEMRYYGQGTRRDGTLYGWPACKAVHPMVGDVGFLGGYYDDHGINLMHDEWLAPMSATTRALGRLVGEEGPDLLLNLHSHEAPPGFLPVAYVPEITRQRIQRLADQCIAALTARGWSTQPLITARPDSEPPPPAPALNLVSILHHCGADLPLLFESPHGLAGFPHAFSYEDLLDIHHVLIHQAAIALQPAVPA